MTTGWLRCVGGWVVGRRPWSQLMSILIQCCVPTFPLIFQVSAQINWCRVQTLCCQHRRYCCLPACLPICLSSYLLAKSLANPIKKNNPPPLSLSLSLSLSLVLFFPLQRQFSPVESSILAFNGNKETMPTANQPPAMSVAKVKVAHATSRIPTANWPEMSQGCLNQRCAIPAKMKECHRLCHWNELWLH